MPSALRSARTPSPFRSRLHDAVDAGKTDDVYALLAGCVGQITFPSPPPLPIRASSRHGHPEPHPYAILS